MANTTCKPIYFREKKNDAKINRGFVKLGCFLIILHKVS